MHLFTESYLSNTDNIAPFENTTLINLINLLYSLLFWPIFILINRSGIFKWCDVANVR